jgi:hypothetical protein
MIRRGKWKLVSQPLTDGTRTMLFNVDEDPGCTRDCITAYPEIGAQLSKHCMRGRQPARTTRVPEP